MTSFAEAHQARLILKMKFHVYPWYKYTAVLPDKEGYSAVIYVKYLNKSIRKTIPIIIGNVSVRTEVEY